MLPYEGVDSTFLKYIFKSINSLYMSNTHNASFTDQLTLEYIPNIIKETLENGGCHSKLYLGGHYIIPNIPAELKDKRTFQCYPLEQFMQSDAHKQYLVDIHLPAFHNNIKEHFKVDTVIFLSEAWIRTCPIDEGKEIKEIKENGNWKEIPIKMEAIIFTIQHDTTNETRIYEMKRNEENELIDIVFNRKFENKPDSEGRFQNLLSIFQS